MAHGDKDRKKNVFVSNNSDNRHFCLAIQRQKFCYETYEKALKACQFSDNQQRVYYCPFCCAYHTTHFLSKKGYMKSVQAKNNERTLAKINKALDSSTENKKEYIDPTIRRIKTAKCNVAIKDLLIKHIEKHLKDSALSMTELSEWFDKVLKIKNDKNVKMAIEDVLKWPFYKQRMAFRVFLLFYIERVGGIYAKSLIEFIFDITTDEMTDVDKKKFGYFLVQYYKDGKLKMTEVTSGGYIKYELAKDEN